MSNPLGSPDIEDVVSSIRRLVSPDGRPRTRDLSHDRLILTPALRVVADPDPEPEPELPLILEPAAVMPEPANEPAQPTLYVVEAEWEDEIWPEPEPTFAEVAAGLEDAELVPPPVAEATARPADDPIPFVPHRRDEPAEEAAPASAEARASDDDNDADDADEAGAIATIDEDVLNEIVRDLIREELQGALGERITRNVRKLVRAEINRALASRALD